MIRNSEDAEMKNFLLALGDFLVTGRGDVRAVVPQRADVDRRSLACACASFPSYTRQARHPCTSLEPVEKDEAGANRRQMSPP